MSLSPSGPLPAPLLRLQHVSMSFAAPSGPPIEVLDDVSAVVPAREMVVVAGRSGSGKTTLLNIAAGLMRPSAGSVTWSDEAVQALSMEALAARRRRHLGYVFQTAGLIASLTAAENAALPGMAGGHRGDDASRSREVLDLVGVGHRARHFPSRLSGGEQQRVGLARALFGDPPLLIVDEPTANLDRRTADDIIELLVALRGAGKALLVAAHDVNLIARADRLVELV